MKHVLSEKCPEHKEMQAEKLLLASLPFSVAAKLDR